MEVLINNYAPSFEDITGLIGGLLGFAAFIISYKKWEKRILSFWQVPWNQTTARKPCSPRMGQRFAMSKNLRLPAYFGQRETRKLGGQAGYFQNYWFCPPLRQPRICCILFKWWLKRAVWSKNGFGRWVAVLAGNPERTLRQTSY